MKEGLLGILKFFFFLLIMPLIVASVLAFQSQVLDLPVVKEQFFLWGAVSFVLVYLFVYNLKEVYVFGQTVVMNLLEFIKPFTHSMPQQSTYVYPYSLGPIFERTKVRSNFIHC